MVSASKSDGVMMSSLDGKIQWKSNLAADVDSVGGIQYVGGSIVLSYTDADWIDHFALIDVSTDEILLDTN